MSENFDYEVCITTKNRHLLELFALDGSGRLKAFTQQSDTHPREGWTMISPVSGQQG